MSDSTIEFLVEDCVNYVLKGFDDANAEGCQIAQSQQSELAWEVFMQSWLSKPLTALAEKAYDIGAAESQDSPLLFMTPVDELVSKIEDAIWKLSKDWQDSSDWWDIDHPFAKRQNETFASGLMLAIKNLVIEHSKKDS